MKHKHPDPMLTKLQQLVIDYAAVERNHYIPGTDRKENDVEHSFSVALLCWFIYESKNLKLDLGKILQYALVHDMVEIHAGDTHAFAGANDREKKKLLEAESLKQFQRNFNKFRGLVKTMELYEQKIDEESRYVWSVDKMQAIILGEIDEWRPYKSPIKINYERFVETHGNQLEQSSQYCKEIFEGLLEYVKVRYYDQPT